VKPIAHPTKWTVVVWTRQEGTPAPVQTIYDYDTQAQADAERDKALEHGNGAYVLPPQAGKRPERLRALGAS
jgi:hypothetical protein